MLAHNLSAQLGLIQRAYEKGDTEKINHALLTVIDLRRMLSTGTHASGSTKEKIGNAVAIWALEPTDWGRGLIGGVSRRSL
ncbi:hypothetical protein [uncultured Roseobacter sp.]|uniref:hypothetical protein n=1 Tax=uncultured Roseobacter sp. TaxID=114847 RepID=UPI00262019C2|nr:hypothetical protein [uncultured Roseobacter sp.]